MSHRIKNTDNIIGENSTFEGSIKLSGALRIDGIYQGENLDMDHLIVGKSGKVKANLENDTIVIEGAILGNITASTRTMLLPTAKILGDISSPELIIQHGVIWDGHCNINTNNDRNVNELIQDIFKAI